MLKRKYKLNAQTHLSWNQRDGKILTSSTEAIGTFTWGTHWSWVSNLTEIYKGKKYYVGQT